MQPGKVRTPISIARRNLAIEYCALAGSSCSGSPWKEALGEVVPIVTVMRCFAEYTSPLRAFALLQGYAQEEVDLPRGSSSPQEAAETTRCPRPRGGSAFG